MKTLTILILAALLAGCTSEKTKEDAFAQGVVFGYYKADSALTAEVSRLQWNENVYVRRHEAAMALVKQLQDSLAACKEGK